MLIMLELCVLHSSPHRGPGVQTVYSQLAPCQIMYKRLDLSCEIFHEPRMQVVLQPLVS